MIPQQSPAQNTPAPTNLFLPKQGSNIFSSPFQPANTNPAPQATGITPPPAQTTTQPPAAAPATNMFGLPANTENKPVTTQPAVNPNPSSVFLNKTTTETQPTQATDNANKPAASNLISYHGNPLQKDLKRVQRQME